MEWSFKSTLIEWREPAPFLFAPVPKSVYEDIKSQSKHLSYGWGCIPIIVQINLTSTTSSLMPRNETYLVPIKMVLQKAENLGVNDCPLIQISIDRSRC